MRFICDTAEKCEDIFCPWGQLNDDVLASWPCSTVGHRVNNIFVLDVEICGCCGAHKSNYSETMGDCSEFHPKETHQCYYCDHEGTDVNRIAVVMPPTEYCCDDGNACNKRWMALRCEDDDREEEVRVILEDYGDGYAGYTNDCGHGDVHCGGRTTEPDPIRRVKCVDCATARIINLL